MEQIPPRARQAILAAARFVGIIPVQQRSRRAKAVIVLLSGYIGGCPGRVDFGPDAKSWLGPKCAQRRTMGLAVTPSAPGPAGIFMRQSAIAFCAMPAAKTIKFVGYEQSA